jgi:triphosphoribosyl-dephospho-CoA synthase
MPSGASRDLIATRSMALHQAYIEACAIELRALKPGNVHRFAEGHGMTVTQFEESARVSAAPLCTPGKPLGERIRDAIVATHTAVGCNTNLGIVLLAAPIIVAAEQSAPGTFRRNLSAVLDTLTVADAIATYEAIRLAQPAGLGHVHDQDVATPPTIGLKEIMALAAGHDRIARQYAEDYADIFDIGIARLRLARAAGASIEWATALAYVDFLAAFPDSHIARKFGSETAELVRRKAALLAVQITTEDDDERRLLALRRFDRVLKNRGPNPGTSADLTVASLLASWCDSAPDSDDLGR